MGHMKEKMTVGRFFVYLFAILFAFVCLYPFLMVIGGSLMTNSEVVNDGFKVFPKEVTFASYKLLLGNGNLILNGYKITLFVTVVGTFCSIIVNGMMGYVLSRKRVAGRKFMNLYVLLTMLFNGGMVPWYLICTRYLHLKNNIFALILPSVVSAWYIFLIRNYFSGIPEEIYEAAKIDGCSYYTIFTKIIFPLMVPTMITGCIFSFMWRWDDFLGALLYVNKTEKYPVSLALKMFCDPSSSSDYGAMFAMATLSILPAVLIFFCLQRYLVEGISTSGLKG